MCEGGPQLCPGMSLPRPAPCLLLPPLQLFCTQPSSGRLVILAGKALQDQVLFSLPSHLLPLLWFLTQDTAFSYSWNTTHSLPR